jgi:hypothetical protein
MLTRLLKFCDGSEIVPDVVHAPKTASAETAMPATAPWIQGLNMCLSMIPRY